MLKNAQRSTFNAQVSVQNLECGDKSRAVRGSRHRFPFAHCAEGGSWGHSPSRPMNRPAKHREGQVSLARGRADTRPPLTTRDRYLQQRDRCLDAPPA